MQMQAVHASAETLRAAEAARAAKQRSDEEAAAKAAAEAAAAAKVRSFHQIASVCQGFVHAALQQRCKQIPRSLHA